MNTLNKTPLEMFYHWEANVPNDVFLRQPVNGEWHEITWSTFAERVRRLASFIQAKNYAPESRIAIIGKNCADWFVIDFAIMLSGHISVPLYPGQDVDSGRYIIEHSESVAIFLGEFDQAANADALIPGSVERIGFHGCSVVPVSHQVEDVVASHAPLSASPVPSAEAMFTILYTSGTTGNPKGVMHAYSTPGSVLTRMQKDLGLSYQAGAERERFMSYLPLSHAAERAIVEMNSLYCNGIVSFSEGLETFAAELQAVKPTFFFSVPRLWVKFKSAIDAKVPKEVQATFDEEQKKGIRQKLGLDDARTILTGSAPCPSDVQNWFQEMGVNLREGYSMTENFCDGCFWLEDRKPTSGCVGKPLSGVEIKFTDDDEVCFRSDGLMRGYYKDQEKTDEALVDGWYHTGDTGRLDEDGNLWLTGRISEVFKTTKGKFIQPTKIEDKFASLTALAQICICGHGLSQPMMLATLAPESTLTDADVIAELAGGIDAVNTDLPAHERVTRVLIDRAEWTMANGLLTPTLKLKRKALAAKYADQIAGSESLPAISFVG